MARQQCRSSQRSLGCHLLTMLGQEVPRGEEASRRGFACWFGEGAGGFNPLHSADVAAEPQCEGGCKRTSWCGCASPTLLSEGTSVVGPFLQRLPGLILNPPTSLQQKGL